MKVKINDKIVKGNSLAYDGCHKIYILQDEKDTTEAKEYGYTIYDLDMIKEIYEKSCPLRFIENWKLDSTLKDLNKTYRSNFYKTFHDYKLTNNKGREEFITDYLKYKTYRQDNKIKELAIAILKDLK